MSLPERPEAELAAAPPETEGEIERLRKAVRALETRFHEIVGGIEAIAWEADAATWQFTFVSPAAERILGYPVHEWRGSRTFWVDHLHPEDREASVELCRAATASGQDHELEYRMIAADGRAVWLRDLVRVVTDAQERPVFLRGILIDITARKEAEEALRKNAARYRLLLERLPAVVWTTDRNLRFTSSEGKALAAMGLAPDQVVGETLFEFFDTSDPDFLPIARHRQALAGETVDYEIEWRGRIFLTHVEPLRDESGAVSGTIGVAQDVTESSSMREQFRHAQKMEAVGRLAGGVAHDFNNLITAITGYTELALRTLHARDPLRQRLEGIRRASERATALAGQLLAFSRKRVVQPGAVDLSEVVAGMGDLLARLIGEDVELVSNLEPGLGRVRADRGEIEQVIANLAVNARDAMPSGGKLVLSTRGVVLDEVPARVHLGVPAGRYALLAVSDTGVGMDPSTRAHLFEPDFPTKEPGKGTGLGLATVYGIVKQCGGGVRVDSEPGKGSTFQIYLPLAGEARPEETTPLPGEVTDRATETVLLVEDEELVRAVVHDALAQQGYDMLVATGGAEAIELAANGSRPIHLLVTDMVMPQMGGRELARRLSASRPGLRVLYMSGYADPAASGDGLLSPRAAYLQKPFTPDEIARKVREVLGAAPTL
ncbi:MAG: PAS domain S-box protein [Planctomycetes bacterium]|nr:PAS domain S-box protein [Planctomycetota bacterium]